MALRVEQSSSLDEAQQSASSSVLSDSVSLGVDIVEIDRMRAILKRSPAFARRAFSSRSKLTVMRQQPLNFTTRHVLQQKKQCSKHWEQGFLRALG